MSTIISTDTKAAGEMLNLSMGPPELPVTQETSDSVDQAGESLSDDDQFSDMFKVPAKVPAPWDPPSLPWLDPMLSWPKLSSSPATGPYPHLQVLEVRMWWIPGMS